MASSFCQDFVQSDYLVKRRYVQIPRDQAKLLDKDIWWSENLSRGPVGMLNVPDRVLQDVKDFHIRKQAKVTQTQHDSSPAGKSSPSHVVAASPRSKRQEKLASSPERENDDCEVDSTQIPWTQTQIQIHEDVEVMGESMNEDAPASWSPSPDHHRLPGNLTKGNNGYMVEDRPSSSGAHSEALVIEPPGLLSQEMGPPVNRAALQAIVSNRPGLTPPSAQIPIATGGSSIQPLAAKQLRTIEESRHPDYEERSREPAHVFPANAKRGATLPDTNQKSSTTTVSTPSFASRPVVEGANQSGPLQIMSDPANFQTRSSHFTPTWEGRYQKRPIRWEVNTETVAAAPSQVSLRAQRGADPNLSRNIQPIIEYRSARTPYDEYKAAYPDYPENTRKFISACLNVKQVMRDRALPEFLYDDYVRAFSTDYLLYISECNRKKPNGILPAINWYNDTVKDVEYTKKVIRKDNLAAILEAHADDVRVVRRSLGDSQSTASESATEESDEDMMDTPEGDEQEELESELSNLEDASRLRGSPELHISSPEAIRDKQDVESGLGKSRIEEDRQPRDMVVLTTPGQTALAGRLMEGSPAENRKEEKTEAVIDAEKPRSSRESRMQSLSPKVISTRNGGGTLDLHKTPTLRKSPVLETTNPNSSKGHIGEQQGKAPTISPPQRASALFSKKRVRGLSVDEYDEDEDDSAFDPPPSKKPTQRSPEESRSRRILETATRSGFTSTMPVVTNPTFAQTSLTGTGKVRPRPLSASGFGAERSDSPISLERSRVKAPRSKKRMSETPQERSESWKAFLKKRMSAGTPSSTAARK